jgi:membrane associated rhomboid family serine protease
VLVIPIRQQDSTVRRLPWVSAALIALNVVVFLATSIGGSGLESAVRRQAKGVVDFVLERPYLSLHPAVAELFDLTPEDMEEARAEMDPRRVPRGEALEREQAELNRLCDSLLKALARLPTRRFGFVPAAPRAETLLTSMFVHAGLLHLLGNMLFLYLSGPFVEDVFGRTVFAVLYVLSGIAAAAAQAVSDPGSTVPMVGASGAVAGVMGAFLFRLSRARVELLVLPIPFLPTLRFNVVLPAFVVLPLWAAEQYWYAHTAPEAGVAWWAHLGGFLFGLAAALAIRLSGIETSWIHPGIEKRISVTQHGGLERALDARLSGDVVRARREIGLVLRDEPDSLDGWRESLEIALAARDDAETGRSATRLLDLLARAGEEDLALELVGDDRLRERRAPARFWLSAAALMERQGDARAALDLYARAADASPDDVGALRALVKRGEILARGGNVREARAAYALAQAHPACQGSWAGLVERALKDLGR